MWEYRAPIVHTTVMWMGRGWETTLNDTSYCTIVLLRAYRRFALQIFLRAPVSGLVEHGHRPPFLRIEAPPQFSSRSHPPRGSMSG